jgi:N-acetyl-gamma-glutamyl-phosphate reductase|nr:N-acetyl-gamma-glutamyl-phosphate reductase [Kofleriaceae bacterium]
MHRVGIFGASGYAGMELRALLDAHPAVEVAFATTDRDAGARGRDCEVALLATPAEASVELAPALLAAGARVVDLSNAFRFQPERAAYGMPELAAGVRAAVRAARLVANPGCYPTAASLALAPLLAAGVIARDDLIVDAMSGVTGAGRRSEDAYSFVELHANARAYRVLRHQHQPEIAQNLGAAASSAVDVTFTPHLVPIARGILATCYARATRDVTADALAELLRAAYAGERFVRVVASADDVQLADVVGTNDCAIGVACAGRRVVVVSAIDNLLKGAAGQAVQNLNLMLGCDERAGLTALRRWHP